MSEYIKYGSVLFGYAGDFASFVQAKKKQVSIMFNRGAHIKGDFPNLEGTGPTARFMRFATVEDVENHAAELARVAVAWCDQVDTPGRRRRVASRRDPSADPRTWSSRPCASPAAPWWGGQATMAAPLMHSVAIKSEAGKIYEAISTGEGLASFWTRDSQAEQTVGID
jgi:Domain of unknown function (DU1801)